MKLKLRPRIKIESNLLLEKHAETLHTFQTTNISKPIT